MFFYEEILRQLDTKIVRYVVVGGVALVLHGSVKHLKKLKRMAGRPQDLADIRALEEMERIEGEDSEG